MRFGACANSVSAQGSPPCALIRQICIGAVSGFGLGRARVLVNAIHSPSGDQRGCVLLSVPRVSGISRFSVQPESTRLLTRKSFSLSPVVFTHTTHLASGEMRNCPADSPSIKSSGFHGSFVGGAFSSSALVAR